jgi:hypothetical protein
VPETRYFVSYDVTVERLKELEAENTMLERIVAEQALDNCEAVNRRCKTTVTALGAGTSCAAHPVAMFG